jgi:hypothetical protein
MTIPIDIIARRTAARIERERAAADPWRSEAILIAEATSAGLGHDAQALAQIGARAAAILLAEARQATQRRAA